MTISRKSGYWFGTEDSDIRTEMVRYSKLNAYEAARFSAAVCTCGSNSFKLESDDEAGVARRTCAKCGDSKLLGDSAEYIADAKIDNHICVCDHDTFGITSGVAMYSGSRDVRWYYIGCRCRACNLIGVFADWKSESGDADAFLAET